MKKNFLILAAIIIGILIIIVTYLFLTRESFSLKLPEIEKIVSIKLEEGKQIKIISDKNKIKTINEIIAKTNYKTHNKSKTEMPVGYNTLIKLSFNYEDEVATTIYIYTKNGKYYLEQPANGIYEIDISVFDSIENYLI